MSEISHTLGEGLNWTSYHDRSSVIVLSSNVFCSSTSIALTALTTTEFPWEYIYIYRVGHEKVARLPFCTCPCYCINFCIYAIYIYIYIHTHRVGHEKVARLPFCTCPCYCINFYIYAIYIYILKFRGVEFLLTS